MNFRLAALTMGALLTFGIAHAVAQTIALSDGRSLPASTPVRLTSQRAGSLFHHPDCPETGRMSGETVSLAAALDGGHAGHALCLDLFFRTPQLPPQSTTATAPTPQQATATMLVERVMNIREAASATSKIIGQLKAFDTPDITAGEPGWAKVTFRDANDVERSGWIALTTAEIEENLLPADSKFSLQLRRVRADEHKDWPLPVRLSIVKGRVRPGFTEEQVLLAHSTPGNWEGKPDLAKTSETAAGKKRSLVYGNTVVHLTNGAVTEIETVER